jgi:hypothetical protein
LNGDEAVFQGGVFSGGNVLHALIMRKTLTDIEVQCVCTNAMLKDSLPCRARSMSAMASRILVLAASSSLKLW